jgi:hypothetical protein
VDGFTWDDGPHVSFTLNSYVRQFLADMVGGEDEAIPSLASNDYRGHWIAHPARVNLYQVPDPLRTQCLSSFLASREDPRPIRNYQDWLHVAFGDLDAVDRLGRESRAEAIVGRYTEHKYLMKMMQLLDVNVDADIVELLAYAKKYAGLDVELSRDERPATTSVVQRARKVLGDREPSGAC